MVHLLLAVDYDTLTILQVFGSKAKAVAERDRKTALTMTERWEEDDYPAYSYIVSSRPVY